MSLNSRPSCSKPSVDTSNLSQSLLTRKIHDQDFAVNTASENLHMLQIRIRGWISQNSQHRDDLTFVVKCVGYDMQ